MFHRQHDLLVIHGTGECAEGTACEQNKFSIAQFESMSFDVVTDPLSFHLYIPS
jgi:hypothetical protein